MVIGSLFLLSYSVFNEFQQRTSEKKRVETLNSFLVAIEEDLERQTYIMGFRALFIIENEITQTGTYNQNVQMSVREIIQNGSLYNEPQTLMLGATFPEIETAINERAAKINANISLSNPTITVSQQDPWHVGLELNTTLVFQEKGGLARWRANKSIQTSISIAHFEDPLYLINTQGRIAVKITQSPFFPFTPPTIIQNLTQHLNNFYYVNTSLSPSFIQRLEGNMSAHPYGIESLVNLNKLSATGVPILDKSVVDYIYFSTANPTAHAISGMPSWFKLDTPHLSIYSVENLTI